MGPYQNDQVGYIGTPQSIGTFKAALDNFLTTFPRWPQFIRTFPTPPTLETILKLASPLEIFSRLASDALPPPDLTPLKPPNENWPDKLWAPIQALRDNWITYAGEINTEGVCRRDGRSNGFCDAVLDVKTLMLENFTNYQIIFSKQCSGTPITLTDDKMISHVYGWGTDLPRRLPARDAQRRLTCLRTRLVTLRISMLIICWSKRHSTS